LHSRSRISEASKASKAATARGPRTWSCARNSCTDILRCTSLKSAHTHVLSPALSPASAPRALRPAAARLERSKNPSALVLRGAEEEGGVAVFMRRAAGAHAQPHASATACVSRSILHVSVRQHTGSVDAARCQRACTAASLCAAQYLYSSTSKARKLGTWRAHACALHSRVALGYDKAAAVGGTQRLVR
jgi:hypothetical protein